MVSNNAYVYTLSLNDNLGVPCREGDFTLQETERVQDTLCQERDGSGLLDVSETL